MPPPDSLIHASSGALGGICAMAITYPLIVISTRAQVEAKQQGESSLEAAIHLVRREGIASFYDGLGSSLIGIAITNGIYYAFFEETRAILLRTQNRPKLSTSLTTLQSMFAGAVAGSMTAVLTNPIWVVNTRQTVRINQSTTGSIIGSKPRSQRMGFLQTILHILKMDGATAFFRGLGPALILVINPILQYTLFEQLKNILIARRKSMYMNSKTGSAVMSLGDIDFFLLGAISKLFATGATYPYLTVKSRMQSGQAEGRGYRGTYDGLSQIVKKDGVKGLYRGIAPKLTQSVLTAAFLFLAKERIYNATKKALLTASRVTPI
ncbi:mitochondrial carrier domain-containing protein [Melampsora americana]|nr:mitochondrial carrier domain-containing protein [Melampsora americana]